MLVSVPRGEEASENQGCCGEYRQSPAPQLFPTRALSHLTPVRLAPLWRPGRCRRWTTALDRLGTPGEPQGLARYKHISSERGQACAVLTSTLLTPSPTWCRGRASLRAARPARSSNQPDLPIGL